MAEEESKLKDLTIIVKWAGKEYPIPVQDEDTVAVLRHEIFKETNVRPNRQKLINLTYKGKPASDDMKLGLMITKQNYKLMMVGSTEEAIEKASAVPEGMKEVTDDLDWDSKEDTYATSRIYLAKVQRRVRDYKVKELNAPREGKRLLVLDIDYTLFDHRSVGEQIKDLMRPYLHEFLETAYEHYNIVIWSASGMRWIEQKMNMLGVSTNPNYKIWFYLDSHACISVNAYLQFNELGIFDTKPLGLIWAKYPQYGPKNTIMIDDISRNFVMNPQSGLKIKAFRHSTWLQEEDRELIKLSVYLVNIAKHCDDFSTLNHSNWQHFKPSTE